MRILTNKLAVFFYSFLFLLVFSFAHVENPNFPTTNRQTELSSKKILTPFVSIVATPASRVAIQKNETIFSCLVLFDPIFRKRAIVPLTTIAHLLLPILSSKHHPPPC